MEEIPGINVFVDRKIVERIDNDLEVKITTYANLQSHERSKLSKLGWTIHSPTCFSYTRMKKMEKEDFNDDWLDEDNGSEE